MAKLSGFVPDSELASVPWAPHHRVLKSALPGLIALNRLYHARFRENIVITDSYRSYAAQQAIKILKPFLAAPPGYSNHGWGLALDLGGGINDPDSQRHAWMLANAYQFGWDLPEWARPRGSKPEPWHWESVHPYTPPASAGETINAMEEATVFIIANNVKGHRQTGTAWVCIPQGNGRPRASVLFGDSIAGLPLLNITNPSSWEALENSIQFV